MALGSRMRDPGSGKKPIPDPGSGFRGQKDTGSRIRIRNTGFNTGVLKSCVADQDPGSFRPWIRDGKSQIFYSEQKQQPVQVCMPTTSTASQTNR
jgi:hypothetical protein